MSAGRLFLVDLLDRARITAPGPQYVEARQLDVARDSRNALFQHPTSTIRLPLPQWASSGELITAAGVATSVWDRVAGAVDFEVGVATEPGGQVAWLRATRLDAHAGAHGRAWSPLRVRFAGAAEIVLRTSTHDPAFAWVGWAEPRIEADRPAPAPRRWPAGNGGERPHHVLLVTADALRVDHCFGAGVRTPAIDALLARGACAIVARAPGTTTPGNYASLLTGRLPHRHGLIDEWGPFPGHVPNLALELARAGYRTVFAASERELADGRAGFGNLFAHVIPCHANPWQSGEVTTRALLSALDALPADAPLLVWAQYFDAHPPRAYPADLVRPYYDRDPCDPANRHDPDELRQIHGAEIVLELAAALDGLRHGLIDGRVPYRLRAVAAVLLGRASAGPDLVAHLRGLGSDAMLGRDEVAFAQWLDEQVDELESGVVPEALLDWLEQVHPRLQEIERDALSWLDGVCDSRYPRAVLKAGCAHVDAQLGALVAGLDARGLLDTTSIVFVSPHGELLGEGGYLYQHHPPLEPVLRAPLLLKAAAAFAQDEFEAPVTTMELTDVLPTLLSLLGLQPPRGLDGRDRLAELRGGEPLAPRPMVSIGHAGQHIVVASQSHKLVRQRLPGIGRDGSALEAGTDRWSYIADGGDEPSSPPADAATLTAVADRVQSSLG